MPRSTETTTTSRSRRWSRRLGRSLLVIAALVAVAAILRDPILQKVVQGQLERMTGGEVTIVDARFEGLSRVRIDEIDIAAPGWEGPARDVLRVEGLSLDLDLPRLLLGGFGFERLRVERALVRIAEEAGDSTRFNVAALRPEPSDRASRRRSRDRDDESGNSGIGEVVIDRLEIETGITDDDEWRLASKAAFNARIDVAPTDSTTHAFLLAAVDDESGFDIASGTFDATSGGFALRTDDVDLRRGISLALSATAGAVISAMEIDGTLRTATVEWMPGGVPFAKLEIDDLAFSPPELDEVDAQWVRYDEGFIVDEDPPLPRIELSRGVIELRGDVLEISGRGGRLGRTEEPDLLPDFGLTVVFRLELAGLLEDIERRSIAELGESLLDTAPFSLEIDIDRFVRQGVAAEVPVDLPRPVASALELLRARSWDLSATASLRRGRIGDRPPAVGEEIVAEASLDLRDGEGMYKGFEYPLHAVVARLVVRDDVIKVQHLAGLGPLDDRIELTGTINGTGDDAGVDLRLRSESIALDDQLLAALPDTTRRGLRNLFDEVALQRLREAGLAGEAPLPGDPESRPFEVGGRGSIDLRIHRPKVLGSPVAVEGSIGLRDVGGVFSRFPYPLIVRRGELILEDLAVILVPPGLEVETLTGGIGTISGRVDLPRDGEGGRDVHPTIDIDVKNDQLSLGLLAAVPPRLEGRPSPESIPGWPGQVLSEAVEPVISMGLGGSIDYSVRIRTRPDGDSTFSVSGRMQDGHATPDRMARETVAEAGLVWPRGFTLTDVRAALEIDDEGVELVSFTGRRDDGEVLARGHFDFESDRGRGIARLREMGADDFLLDLVPEGSLEDARRLWDRWSPQGRFNAELTWTRRDDDTELDLKAEPLWVEFDTAVGRTRLDRERGRINFHPGWIEIEDLALRLSTADREDAALRLDGGYGFDREIGIRTLLGNLDTARFEAPAVEEVLRLAAGDALADWWIERAPEGRFKGRFEVSTGRREGVDFDIELEPRSFSILSRIEDPGSRGGGEVLGDGRIVIDDREVELGPIELMAADGTRTRFEARVEDVSRPEIRGSFDISLPDTSVPEVGFLPPPFSSILSAEAVEAKDVAVQGSLLASFWDPTDLPGVRDAGIPHLFRTEGNIDVDSITWTIGESPIVIRPDADGIDMSLTAIDGNPTDFELDAEFELIDVAGRPVHGAVATGTLASPAGSDSPVLHVDVLRGTIGGGGVEVGIDFEPEVGRYGFNVVLADVDLGSIAAVGDEYERTPADSASPGRLYANLAIGGLEAFPASRVGSGRVVVRDASFAGDGALALLQLGQLLPPIQDQLAVATTDLLIDGDQVLLDPIILDASTITVEGLGQMRLDDWEWSLRLRPRGRVPGWSDLVSAISGTMAAVDVRGTPAEPTMTVVPLPVIIPRSELPPLAPSTRPIEDPAPPSENQP